MNSWSLDYFEEHGIAIDGENYDRDDVPAADVNGDPIAIPQNIAALEAAGQMALAL